MLRKKKKLHAVIAVSVYNLLNLVLCMYLVNPTFHIGVCACVYVCVCGKHICVGMHCWCMHVCVCVDVHLNFCCQYLYLKKNCKHLQSVCVRHYKHPLSFLSTLKLRNNSDPFPYSLRTSSHLVQTLLHKIKMGRMTDLLDFSEKHTICHELDASVRRRIPFIPDLVRHLPVNVEKPYFTNMLQNLLH